MLISDGTVDKLPVRCTHLQSTILILSSIDKLRFYIISLILRAIARKHARGTLKSGCPTAHHHFTKERTIEKHVSEWKKVSSAQFKTLDMFADSVLVLGAYLCMPEQFRCSAVSGSSHWGQPERADAMHTFKFGKKGKASTLILDHHQSPGSHDSAL